MQTVSLLEGENRIKIGEEVFINNHDTDRTVWLMDYGVEITQTDGVISFGIYKADAWNYGSKNLEFTIQLKENK